MSALTDEILKLTVDERLRLIETIRDSVAASFLTLPISEIQKRRVNGHFDPTAADPLSRGWIDDPNYWPGHYAIKLLKHRSKTDEEQLIETYIRLNNEQFGYRADARLKSGPSIWAIVSFLDLYEGDLKQIVSHFEISQEEIDAALAFYRRNKKYIDAKIIVNES